jgi:hypothetical protein
MNATNHFKQTIQTYLEQRAIDDTLFAVSFRKPHKSIDDCISYIFNTVQRSGCNGYTVEDASIWRDYIDLLRFFGKDLHNAKYVCPTDLTAEHDKQVQKKKDWQERESKERARKKALEDEQCFKELKSKFFGIQFTDGLIEVRTLESVEEVMQEGDIMHHCVFANEYHLKPDSLLLSACVDGKKTETIELSLSQMKVLQSRGVCNKNTEYHDRIIRLVKKNIRKIRQRMAA